MRFDILTNLAAVINVRSVSKTVALAIVAMGAVACATTTDDTSSDESNITPDSADTLWKLGELCEQNIDRMKAVKSQELRDGVARWQCGDRPGVDGEEDRGQEYCEYFAVNGGKRVNSMSKVDKSKGLSCYFTSLYADVDGGFGANTALDKNLAKALASKENLNATFDSSLVRMHGQFNTRGAATTLITDASNIKKSIGTPEHKKFERMAACITAAHLGANRADLKKLCDGPDLANDANWKKVTDKGVKLFTQKDGGEGYEQQADMYACMSVQRLQHGGVDWRMSDPHISQVAVRATSECSCAYSALPTGLQGFPQGTWSGADALPPGCRRAVVDGKPSDTLTICEITPQQMDDVELNLDTSDNIQKFCNDTWGKDIVLTAPLRAVEKSGSCSVKTGEFCTGFTKGAK